MYNIEFIHDLQKFECWCLQTAFIHIANNLEEVQL